MLHKTKAWNNLNNKTYHLNKQLHNNSNHKPLLSLNRIKKLQTFFLNHQSNQYNNSKHKFNRRMIFLRLQILNRMMTFLEKLASHHKVKLLQLTYLELYSKLHLTNQLSKTKTISNSTMNFSATHHLTTIVVIMISCS